MYARSSARVDDAKPLNLHQWFTRLRQLPLGEAFRRVWAFSISLPRSIWKIISLQRKLQREGYRLHLVVLVMRMGDIISAGPILKHLRRPGYQMVWVAAQPYADLVRCIPLVSNVVEVSCLTEWMFLSHIFPSIERTVLHFDQVLCGFFGLPLHNPNPEGVTESNHYNFGTLLDGYSLIALGERIDERPELLLDAVLDLPPRTQIIQGHQPQLAALHCVSEDRQRDWPAERFRLVARWLIEKHGFRIIELGRAPVLGGIPEVEALGGALPLSRQAAILQKAHLFIGVDSGFAHIANAFSVPSVLLIGQLRDYTGHIPWSGPWKQGDGCIIIRANGRLAELEVPPVLTAIAKMIETSPGAVTNEL